MIKKSNFNYNNSDENLNKSKQEIENDRKNKLFLNNMLKRMTEEKYI